MSWKTTELYLSVPESTAAGSTVCTNVCDGGLWGGVSGRISTRLPQQWHSWVLVQLCRSNYQKLYISVLTWCLTVKSLSRCPLMLLGLTLSSLAKSVPGMLVASRCQISHFQSSLLGSQPWSFRLTWHHRSHDHLTSGRPFRVGGPLEPSCYL